MGLDLVIYNEKGRPRERGRGNEERETLIDIGVCQRTMRLQGVFLPNTSVADHSQATRRNLYSFQRLPRSWRLEQKVGRR